MLSFMLLEQKIEIETDDLNFKTYPELASWAKKIGIMEKESKSNNIPELKDGEFAIPLKEKEKEKQLNIKTGRLKNKKVVKYLITNIKPEDRSLKNIPKYADNSPKLRFQDWLELKKSPKLYNKLDNMSWGWSPNGSCYGWSHRAVGEFKIGKEIKPDTIGNPKHNESWTIKTNEEAEMMAKLFASDVS